MSLVERSFALSLLSKSSYLTNNNTGKAKKADLQAKPGSTDRVQPTSLSYEREQLLIYIYIIENESERMRIEMKRKGGQIRGFYSGTLSKWNVDED